MLWHRQRTSNRPWPYMGRSEAPCHHRHHERETCSVLQAEIRSQMVFRYEIELYATLCSVLSTEDETRI